MGFIFKDDFYFIFYYNYWYIKKCIVILYDLVCSWNISVVEGYDVEVLFKVFYDVSIVKGRFICILVKIFKGKGILGIKKKLRYFSYKSIEEFKMRFLNF